MSRLLGQVDPSSPYFPGLEPTLLYGAMPLCVISSGILLMAPGLLGALWLGRGRCFSSWLIESFALSLLTISALVTLAEALTGALMGRSFFALVLGLASVLGLGLERRATHGALIAAPLSKGPTRSLLVAVFGLPLLLCIALTPKIFWEAFNGDGAHAYESTRLLLHYTLPFWSGDAGVVSSWPGMVGVASVYPASWFMRLFGETEAAVRLPLLLLAPLLFAAIVAVAQAARDRLLDARAIALIAGAVLSFVLVMSYSATYDPYCADMSMPGVMDSMGMIWVLGAAAAFARGESRWLLLFALLALLTSPAGLLQLGAALVGLLVSQRAWPWRRVAVLAGGLLGCLAALAIAPTLLELLGSRRPGSEHGPLRFLLKFAYIATGDFTRIAWAALPCGLYPALALLSWRRADTLSRCLITVVGILFPMYYLMGFVSLHYFVPVMLLPLAIFWREVDSSSFRAPAWLGCTLGLCAALWFALPASHAIYTGTREVGMRLEVAGFPGYAQMDPAIFAASERLEALFPTDYHADVPERAYGGSPLAWLFYAQQPAASTDSKSYLLASAQLAPPAFARELYRDELAAVFVLDEGQWELDRRLKPATSKGKAVYAVPRHKLFNRNAASERPGFFSPGHWLLGLLQAE